MALKIAIFALLLTGSMSLQINIRKKSLIAEAGNKNQMSGIKEQSAVKLAMQLIPAGSKLKDYLPQTSMECTEGASPRGDNDALHRSCRLKGMCFDVANKNLLWNSRDHPEAPAPDELFSLLGSSSSRDKMDDGIHSLLFASRRALEVKLKSTSKVAILQGATALLARRHAAYNAGHLTMQTMMALEGLADSHGITAPKDRVVAFLDSCWDGSMPRISKTNAKFQKLCSKFTADFASPLSAHPLIEMLELNQTTTNLLGKPVTDLDYLCFEDAVGGIGKYDPYSNSWAESDSWVKPYRENVFKHYHKQPPAPQDKGCSLVYFHKTSAHGLHTPENMGEVHEVLSMWAEKRRVKYTNTSLATLAVDEQLELLKDTNILVSVPGATSMSKFFLAPGSDLVLLDNNYDVNAVLKHSQEVHLTTGEQKEGRVDLVQLRQQLDDIAEKRACK